MNAIHLHGTNAPARTSEIERSLRSIPGVVSIVTGADGGMTSVIFDEHTTDPATIVAAIRRSDSAPAA